MKEVSFPCTSMSKQPYVSQCIFFLSWQSECPRELLQPMSLIPTCPQSQPVLFSLLWGFRVTTFIFEAPHGQALGQMSKPITNSIGGHCFCAWGRAQLCISRAFSGGSLAMGMNSSRSHHRPPYCVQRALCSPREGKITHSQINRD